MKFLRNLFRKRTKAERAAIAANVLGDVRMAMIILNEK
jgi:hypothetical protein